MEYNTMVFGSAVTVSINHENGRITVDGLITQEEFDRDRNDSKNIWNMYKSYRENDVVVRSGSGYCGVYRFNPAHPVKEDYVESDTLHSTTAEEVAQNFFRFYPNMFDIYEQKRIILLLRYHDLGEKRDIPDDGSSNPDEKFEMELGNLMERIYHLPPFMQEQLIRDFIMFEHAGLEYWSDRDRKIMQFAKLCDKLDAPLGAFVYELQGRKGSLAFKDKHYGGITDQDKGYIRQTGDDSQAGVWSAHFIDKYLFYEDVELFIAVIMEACIDVRGAVFPWMYEFCQKRGISEGLLSKML